MAKDAHGIPCDCADEADEPMGGVRRGIHENVWLKSQSTVYLGMGQNLVPLVNIKIAGKWMFIPLKMVLIGIDP